MEGSLSEHQQAQEAGRSDAGMNVVCDECGRCFRRESDKACHKFLSESERPSRICAV